MYHKLSDAFQEIRENWRLMSFYERFEQLVAMVLGFVIAVIVVIALIQLIRKAFLLLVLNSFDPLEHSVFQVLFGMIMTLLIAMEFKHSIVRVALRKDCIIQVKTVVLIALLALARKFIVLDAHSISAGKIAALAAATLVLGLVYWLIRERDDHEAEFEARHGASRATTPDRPR